VEPLIASTGMAGSMTLSAGNNVVYILNPKRGDRVSDFRQPFDEELRIKMPVFYI